MPDAGKISSASISADPTIPNTSVTSLATKVSTNASLGVILVFPDTAVRLISDLLLIVASCAVKFIELICSFLPMCACLRYSWPATLGALQTKYRLKMLVAQVVPVIEHSLAYAAEWRKQLTRQRRCENRKIEAAALASDFLCQAAPSLRRIHHAVAAVSQRVIHRSLRIRLKHPRHHVVADID